MANADRRLLVLYDADCGLCLSAARLLRRLDRRRRLYLLPAQEADRIVDAPHMDALLDAIHVRDPAGRWSVAGAACIRIAAEVPLLRPLAMVGRIPAAMVAIESAYALVARNRQRISRLLGDQTCDIGSGTP